MESTGILPVKGGQTIEQIRESVIAAGMTPATIEEEGMVLLAAYKGSGAIPLTDEAMAMLDQARHERCMSLLFLPKEGGALMFEIQVDSPEDSAPDFWATSFWVGKEGGENPGFVVVRPG